MNIFQRFATILLVVSSCLGPSSPTAADSRIYLPLLATPAGVASSGGWSTVAANPQRTSWAPDDAPGAVHVEWYRPIDAYIPPSFQVISAQGLVYIATARGLYALDAATGTTAWRYDTELPLGNSPTVSDGLVFVGGYDHKVHALNAATGQPIWEFAGARAGYDTNPLVINHRVYLGNRDGRFYALDATDGGLLWQYPPAGQSPLAPIHLSAAFKNGVVFFASNDNHAYALNANTGALVWKSKKLVGDGYDVFWPVVYHEPSSKKDYVIYSGSLAYRENARPGTRSIEGDDSYQIYSSVWTGLNSDTLGPTVVLNEPWSVNKTVVDYSRVLEFYENMPDPVGTSALHKPWLRIYTVLDATTGQEATMDTDHDGYPEYFPVMPTYNPGNMHPPVIGKDNLIYVSNDYQRNGQGRVMGWKFGTPYFALLPLAGASDEPQILSSAGSSVYRVLCCDRVGDRGKIDGPSTNAPLWHYVSSLADLAPGYDQKMWFIDPAILDRITGNYGNANGIYGEHGYQNPIVAAGGRLLVHRSNAIIAFGAGPARGKQPLLTTIPIQSTLATPSTQELAARLETEVQKIVSAGLLKPGYYQDSQFTNWFSYLDNYFENPGDTLYTLSLAYPHLSSGLQQRVKSYLGNTFFPKYYDPVMHFRLGWQDGVQRTSAQIPPEVEADFANLPVDYRDGFEERQSWFYAGYLNVNPNNFYAMWKYAANVTAPTGGANALHIYELAKDKLTTGSCASFDCIKVGPNATDAHLLEYPYEMNAYIAGLYGFLQLQTLAGQSAIDSDLRLRATAELNRIKDLRIKRFSKNTPWTDYAHGYGRRMLNISRNFIMLTPELASDMRQSILPQVKEALAEYESVGPYWFVSRFTAAYAESSMQNLYDYPALFQARAYILKQPRSELTKYLDMPAFERGDLFYIQNLIAAIEASG